MATEGKIIRTVDLYDNVLTEKVGDFSAKVPITGTERNPQIAQRIVNERTEYRLETIINILDLADQKKIDAIAEGKSVIDGVGQYLLNLSGAFEGESPVFDALKHKFGVTFTPGKAVFDALKKLIPDFRLAKTGPVINSITDSTTNTVNETLTSGAPAIISGASLMIKGDDPSVGIYFTADTAGSTPVKVPLIVTNTISQIIVQLPQLADGQYRLSVTTQAGANYKMLKEPRSYQFPILLTVGEKPSGGGDDDKPDSI